MRARLRNIAITAVVLLLVGLSLFYFVYLPFTSCPDASAQGYAFYVKVVNDTSGGSPVSGASVSGSYISMCISGNGTTTKTDASKLPTQVTPASGTIMEPADGGNYSIVIQYSGQKYTFDAYVRPIDTTTLTLSVPSGTWNETYTND